MIVTGLSHVTNQPLNLDLGDFFRSLVKQFHRKAPVQDFSLARLDPVKQTRYGTRDGHAVVVYESLVDEP